MAQAMTPTERPRKNPKVADDGWAPLPGWTILFDSLNGVSVAPYHAGSGDEYSLGREHALADLGEILRQRGR